MEHTKLDKAMIPHERANLIDDLFKEYILMRTRCATAGIYRNYIFDEGFLWDWFYCGLRYGPEDPEKANCLDLLIAGHESHALTFARTGSSPEWALTGIPVAPSHDPNPSGKFKTPMELRAVQREGSPEEKAQQPSNRHSHVPKRRSMSSRYSHVFDSIKRKSMTGIPNWHCLDNGLFLLSKSIRDTIWYLQFHHIILAQGFVVFSWLRPRFYILDIFGIAF